MRRIITYVATSADGYIARPDGGVEWLDRPRPPGNYGYAAFSRSIDTILMGRKTYEKGLEFEAEGVGGAFDPRLSHYVFTHTPGAARKGIEFVSGDIAPFAQQLRRRSGKHIWMMGGANLIAAFLDVGGIDEFIIHVVPIFIGEGIPLIAPRLRVLPLKLRSCRRFRDGVVRIHYDLTARKKTAR